MDVPIHVEKYSNQDSNRYPFVSRRQVAERLRSDREFLLRGVGIMCERHAARQRGESGVTGWGSGDGRKVEGPSRRALDGTATEEDLAILAEVVPRYARPIAATIRMAPVADKATPKEAAAAPVPAPAPPEAKQPEASLPQSYMEEREAQKSQCTDLESCTKECDAGISSACKVAGDQISVIAEETGKPADDLRRMKFYEKGCEAGSHSSCYTLALQLSVGEGIPEDDRSAVRIRRKSCDAGYSAACAALATDLAFGTGVKQDLMEASKLAATACNSGVKNACEIAERIRGETIPVVTEFASLLLGPKKYENKPIKLEGVHVSRVGPRRGTIKAVDGGAADALKAKLADGAGEGASKEWLAIESGTWTKVYSISGQVVLDSVGDPTLEVGEVDID